MKRLVSLFLVSCMMLVLIGSYRYTSYAQDSIDFSEPLLMKFSKDINEQSIYTDIKIYDEKSNEIPILINLKTKREAVIIPLYDLSETKVSIKTNLGTYELSKYSGELFLNSEENLKRISQIQGSYYRGAVPEMTVADEAAKGSGNGSDMGGMSNTNVQVEGVDESDIVKTDGQYIYYLKDNQVVIVSAAKESMKLMSTIGYLHEALYPTEIYIDKDTLVVLGNSYGPKGSFAKAVIYDVTDRQNPVLKRVIEQEGNYVSSRKIGSDIHIISSHYVYYPWEGVPFPRYKDSIAGEEYKTIDPGKIMIYPRYPSSSIVLISSTDILGNNETKITSFVGNADNVYMTSNSMYLTYQEMPYYIMPFPMPIIDGPEQPVTDEELKNQEIESKIAPDIWPPGRPIMPYNPKITTNIKKFAIENESIVFKAQNKIQGNVLNQFSMDEHNGYFRVAYTRDNWNFENGSSITVFDKDMNRVGSIDGIAKGERIYSVRFMGDRAYMVTFKTIDPFFVMDMSRPSEPKMLGYLKIPGYSDYLHPFDENHIIGFGKDTMEMGGNAFQLGMKISLFDVTDFANPVEKDVEIIGDRGTESELLYNHKALMYDKNRSLMGFPVTLARLPVNAKSDIHGFPPYGEQVFQGAYIYNISAENGIDLRGTITHIENFNPYNYLYNNEIRRVIYIGDTIYTISNNWIMATDINSMKNLSKVNISVY